MNTEDLATYLRLTPEFGGTRFGPFEGIEVRLGSDPERCHIVLQPELGVQTEHVKLFRQGLENLILAPSDRTATVYLFRMNTGKPSQLTTPTAVRPGDAFALVTIGGPRFIIELDELPEAIKEERARAKGKSRGPRGRLSKDALAGEAKRQAFTSLLVTGPAQIAQRMITFVKSGAIFMPRNIFLGVAMLGGWVFGGVSMCSNKSLKKDYATSQTRVVECNEELGFARDMNGDSRTYTFQELAAAIIGSEALGVALENDDSLRAAVKKKTKDILTQSSSQYDWLIKRKSSKTNDFITWRNRLMENEAMEIETRLLFVWLAARPGKLQSDFGKVRDSEETNVCGRGPLKITYRQAVSLGLSVQVDAFVSQNPEVVQEDRDKTEELLIDTLVAAGDSTLPETFTVLGDPLRQGRGGCLHLEGGDDRIEMATLIRNFSRTMSDDVADLPAADSNAGAVARIAKYWASDLMEVDYREEDPGINFSESTVGSVLDGFDNKGSWVLSRTADTIAKAIALPCLTALKGDPELAEETLGEDIPSPVHCLVLDWNLRNPN
ncbi:MAG: hypothetical protein ACPGTU_05005 [Myxococcota bacterium]